MLNNKFGSNVSMRRSIPSFIDREMSTAGELTKPRDISREENTSRLREADTSRLTKDSNR